MLKVLAFTEYIFDDDLVFILYLCKVLFDLMRPPVLNITVKGDLCMHCQAH